MILVGLPVFLTLTYQQTAPYGRYAGEVSVTFDPRVSIFADWGSFRPAGSMVLRLRARESGEIFRFMAPHLYHAPLGPHVARVCRQLAWFAQEIPAFAMPVYFVSQAGRLCSRPPLLP